MPTIKERMAAQAAQAPAQSKPVGTIRERMARGKKLDEFKARQAEEKPYDPTDDMSTFDRTLAGVGGGMVNMAEGLGNMVGLVDDEDVLERQKLDSYLDDTTAGSAGKFIGEMAALAPLGLIGKGAQVAHKAAKASKYAPKLAQALTGRTAAVAAEGAAGGAILSNPNERGTGATLGAGGGVLLNKALAGVSRVGKDGIAKVSKGAEELMDMVQRKTGKRPHIPLGMAVDKQADALSAKAGTYADVASLIPSAREKMGRQAGELADDVYETNLRTVFGGAKADEAVKVFRKTGDVQAAIDAGKNAGKAKVKRLTPTQEVLEGAAANSPKGRYTPKKLIRASEKAGKGQGRDISNSPLRSVANTMDDVLSKTVGGSNVASREMVREIGGLLGKSVDLVPKAGEFFGSQRVQRFIMGNTGWQKKLQAAVASGRGQDVRQVMSAMRRAMSVQPAVQEESALGNQAEAKVNEYANQLRSM